ncbi:hypothetical protein Salat_0638100 [Sesamum alatum]|uniref:Uncharacterized protein n=1 Tax=Sesamum alatum TaxID=300844 RepID=A0AAE1YRD0_9LAMI|nr:hypothetical protein Salat_0638100 [Sesamum alatum]
MNARIAQLSGALRGGLSSANVSRSEADISAPHVPSQPLSSSPPVVVGDGAPVVAAPLAEGAGVAVSTNAVVAEAAAKAGLSKKCKCKHKKHRSKGSSKSSRRSQS